MCYNLNWYKQIQICVNVWKSPSETHVQGVDGSSPSGPTVDNQPLTIYFVGGFFFGARFVPGSNREQERLYMLMRDSNYVPLEEKRSVRTTTYLSYPFGSLALLAKAFDWQSRGHGFNSDMLHTDYQKIAIDQICRPFLLYAQKSSQLPASSPFPINT